jgi:hypothetical protein
VIEMSWRLSSGYLDLEIFRSWKYGGVYLVDFWEINSVDFWTSIFLGCGNYLVGFCT